MILIQHALMPDAFIETYRKPASSDLGHAVTVERPARFDLTSIP